MILFMIGTIARDIPNRAVEFAKTLELKYFLYCQQVLKKLFVKCRLLVSHFTCMA